MRCVPVVGARVAAHPRPGAAGACAGAGPRRRFDGERDDGHPRGTGRLRPLGGVRMPRLVIRRHAPLPAADGERRRLRRPAVPRRGRADPGSAPAARSVGAGRQCARGRCARTRLSVVRRPQRAHRHGGLPIRAQRARRRPGHDQRRVPGAGARAHEPACDRRRHCGPGARRGGSRHRRSGPRRERLVRCPCPARRAVRRRDPLTVDPPALGHRARGTVARLPVGRGMQEHPLRCSGSSRAPTRGPTWTRGRPTAWCATRPSWRVRAPTT